MRPSPREASVSARAGMAIDANRSRASASGASASRRARPGNGPGRGGHRPLGHVVERSPAIGRFGVHRRGLDMIAGRLGELGPDAASSCSRDGDGLDSGGEPLGEQSLVECQRDAHERRQERALGEGGGGARARRAPAAAPALLAVALSSRSCATAAKASAMNAGRPMPRTARQARRVGGFFRGAAFREQPQQQRAWFDVAHVTAGLDPVRNRACLGERLLGVAEIGQSGRDRGAVCSTISAIPRRSQKAIASPKTSSAARGPR